MILFIKTNELFVYEISIYVNYFAYIVVDRCSDKLTDKRPIVPKVTSDSSSDYPQFKFPSRFSRKKIPSFSE